MSRLVLLTLTLITLSFGGASALHQDAVDAVQSAHRDLNSLSNGVRSEILNLSSSLSDSPGSGF